MEFHFLHHPELKTMIDPRWGGILNMEGVAGVNSDGGGRFGRNGRSTSCSWNPARVKNDFPWGKSFFMSLVHQPVPRLRAASTKKRDLKKWFPSQPNSFFQILKYGLRPLEGYESRWGGNFKHEPLKK